MQVAWDLQAITGPRPTGLGYSVQLLLDAYQQYGAADGKPSQIIALRPNNNDRALRGVPERLLWEQWRLPRLLNAQSRRAGNGTAAGQGSPDLLYSPALGSPLSSPIPRVAHVHDLIPLTDPAQFSGMARWYWTQLLPRSWQGCSVLTVSNASLVDEVASRLSYPREKIHVVPYYAALDAEDSALALAKPKPSSHPYFMMLATHEPRKNHVLTLNALAILAERGLRPLLVCLGSNTLHTQLLRQLAQKLGVGEQVSWPGYAPRETVLDLLAHATALLFVSKHEGYGMPPQEAQQLGTPVVLSDIACHRAVYDDPRRWEQVALEQRCKLPFVAVQDDAALADAMQRLLEDQTHRAQLRDAGFAYQRSFSRQETAAALRAAFASVG